MKIRLLFLLALTGISCHPLQAASYYAKKALTGAATLGYWGALYHDSVQDYKSLYYFTRDLEDLYSDYPKEVQTDTTLTRMIHQEAIKKGLDPKKIYIHDDGSENTRVCTTAESVRSLFTKNEYHLFLGSLPYCDETWKTPIIQHELNHIKYRHTPLRRSAEFAIPLATHLLISRAFRLPFQLLGAAHGFRTALLPHVTEKILLLPTVLAAKDYLTKNTWTQTIKPWLRRYQERQADLNIDDDPEIIKGRIDSLQYYYKSVIQKFGKEAIDNAHRNGTHPHPLKRIAYMEKKLHNALEKQKKEAK